MSKGEQNEKKRMGGVCIVIEKKQEEPEEIRTFEDALRLIFSALEPSCCCGCEKQPADEERDFERDDIFAMMNEQELAAHDLLDTFVHTPIIGLPENSDTLDARIEHAEWNTDEYRQEIAELLASFEGEIAYYVYLKNSAVSDEETLTDVLENIQEAIYAIVQSARELEILTRIEELELQMDQSSVSMNDAYEERDVLLEQLKELYESGDYEFEEEDESDDEGDDNPGPEA